MVFPANRAGRERLRGIKHADSIVLDPHKADVAAVFFGIGCLDRVLSVRLLSTKRCS
jgi:glutamate/tyrosine decarboxylase-like PLP-dependent enzyme